MRLTVILILFQLLSGCAAQPNFNTVVGGNDFSQAGLTYITPVGFEWKILVQQTSRTNIATHGRNKDETYMISTTMYNIPPDQKAEEFLTYFKSESSGEPNTGRFEKISERIQLDKDRIEVCINYSRSSKDYGAKRSGEYTIYEVYGMHCIHPHKSSIAAYIEISRKSPFSQTDSPIDEIGRKLLKSVKLRDFKV